MPATTTSRGRAVDGPRQRCDVIDCSHVPVVHDPLVQQGWRRGQLPALLSHLSILYRRMPKLCPRHATPRHTRRATPNATPRHAPRHATPRHPQGTFVSADQVCLSSDDTVDGATSVSFTIPASAYVSNANDVGDPFMLSLFRPAPAIGGKDLEAVLMARGLNETHLRSPFDASAPPLRQAQEHGRRVFDRKPAVLYFGRHRHHHFRSVRLCSVGT